MMIRVFIIACAMAMIGWCDVRVEHGLLTITGYESCYYSINGDSYKVDNVTGRFIHPGMVLGLIKWKCNNDYGNIFSDIECRDCGMYCAYNQQFEKCKSVWTPVVFGIMLTIMVLLIIMLSITCCCRNKFSYFIDWMIYRYLTINDRRRERKVARLNKITGMRNPIFFRLIVTKSGVINDLIKRSRLVIRKRVTGDEPIYAEITQNEVDSNRFSNDLEARVLNSSHHRMGVSAARLAVAALALQSGIQETSACDKTLFLSSNGKICDQSTCNDIKMYSMAISTGSNICFKTIDGERFEIKMGDARLVTRYQAEYYSCDYKITTNHTWRCKQLNSDCWNNGKCYDGYEHPDINRTNTMKLPAGYGCNTDTLGCDEWCPMGTACTWYRWQINPIVHDCHKVYRKMSEIWQVSIFIKYKGNKRHIKMNTNNPQYELTGHDIEGLKNMPLAITSMVTEVMHLKNSIIMMDKPYEVDAAMPNMPVKNMIGDFQMALNNESYSFNSADLHCKVHSCVPYCNVPESGVSKLKGTKSAMIPTEQVMKNGDYLIKRMLPIDATATMMFGSIDIDSLKIIPSHCQIAVQNTYACIGCTMKPYAIIKAYLIKEEGMLEYESNCTWAKSFFSCNPEPYVMQLEDDQQICSVTFPSINQTITVNFNYEFVGELSLLRTYYSETVGDSLVSMVSDKSFWASIFGSLNLMAVLSVSSVAAFKLIRLGLAYKTEEKIARV